MAGGPSIDGSRTIVRESAMKSAESVGMIAGTGGTNEVVAGRNVATGNAVADRATGMAVVGVRTEASLHFLLKKWRPVGRQKEGETQQVG